MLSRLAPLERLVGFDRLTVWHRVNGKLCVSLIVAHALLITAGYSLADRLTFGHEFSRLLRRLSGNGHGDDRHRHHGAGRAQLDHDRAAADEV